MLCEFFITQIPNNPPSNKLRSSLVLVGLSFRAGNSAELANASRTISTMRDPSDIRLRPSLTAEQLQRVVGDGIGEPISKVSGEPRI